ncbi:hypothetical protein D3C87_241670 [compost metagenome]
MKTILLLCSLLLSPAGSFASVWVAIFEDYGRVEVSTHRQGLRIHTELQVEPRQRYMVKLTSSCQTTTSYQTYFRQSLEVDSISDKNGKISYYTPIPGFTERDLASRQIDTLALYKLEKAHWRTITCVALQELETSSDQMPFGWP